MRCVKGGYGPLRKRKPGSGPHLLRWGLVSQWRPIKFNLRRQILVRKLCGLKARARVSLLLRDLDRNDDHRHDDEDDED